jgi:hypothetical protein
VDVREFVVELVKVAAAAAVGLTVGGGVATTVSEGRSAEQQGSLGGVFNYLEGRIGELEDDVDACRRGE